ncbi:GAF domain-containing protein [bacterium]|nr:GAF domain-containing protein [bacterium]
MKDLVALTETMISSSDPGELYQQLTERIAQITGARACLIALYDRNRKRFLTQKPHYGIKEKHSIPMEYQVTLEYHRLWNFRKQGVLLSNNPQNDPRVFPGFVKNYFIKSVIIAPMIVQQQLLGIIAILNKRNGFTEFDSYLGSIVAYQTGIILTNALLISEEKRRTEQIRVLNEAARQTTANLSVEDLVQNAIIAIQKTLRLTEVGIYLPAENDNILELKASSGPYHRLIHEQGYIQSIEVGFIGYSFREKKTIYSNDCRNHPYFMQHPMIPANSEACIPVAREGKVLAIINVESTEYGAFAPGDIVMLETLADQLATAFHNAIAYANERKHNEQMQLLSELISELASILDSAQIVKTVVERIKQRFHYYFVTFAWADQEERVLKDWYFLPKFDKDVPSIPFEKGLTGRAVRSGKAVLVNNTAEDPDYVTVFEEVRSEVVMPVKIADTVVAIIDLQSDRLNAFDDSDLLILETLAHAVSTALQNAASYQRMERINEKLAQIAQQKDEIVQIVAHDFRSPLTVIRGYMDFLLKKADWKDERQKEIMETVSLQALRLQKLAEATLKASRLDSGEISFSYEKLDLQFFLRRLILPWSEKHEFKLETPSDLPLIRADAGRMQEVMENLLSNAINYSPDGGTIEVSVRAIPAAELPVGFVPEEGPQRYLMVSVADEGIGIPAAKKQLLFQRFSRVHDNKRIEGIGLGLYIAKKMIETHGGRIWFEDREKGAKFCFVIPALEQEAAVENILIVDDDIHTIRLLHRALSGLGFDIVTATDGREALDKLYRFSPQLVILDVTMPVLGGLEFIERMKGNEETKHTRVIVFTGKTDFCLPTEYSSIPVISKNAGIQALKAEMNKILNAEAQRRRG